MEDKMFKQLAKQVAVAQAAVCRFTGITEARAEDFAEKGKFDEAIELYRDLIYIHKEKPNAMSKKWMKEYEARIQDIRMKRVQMALTV